ncbi:hypothetical protein [Haloarchaeobius litoreus]|uniref:Uncharacterized protein n=1 Tax=Haloarchaeobius litoreus TaxID=755306 RepID=A0ABD6DLH2_9EURY|nr:hypothetical protein [Haloarchaeobius litoreus]
MLSPTRRRLLGAASTALSLVVAGCSSSEGGQDGPPPTSLGPTERTTHTESPPTTTEAATEPTTTTWTPVDDGTADPAPTCGEKYQSIEPYWVVQSYDPLAGFELKLDSQSISIGERFGATLTNISGEYNGTGNRRKIDIQYRSEDGWHTILGWEEAFAGWTDIGVGHDPGEGFRWEFPFTQEGISEAVNRRLEFHACRPIRAGEYRFVYWGVTTELAVEEDYETDYAIAAPFTVVAE